MAQLNEKLHDKSMETCEFNEKSLKNRRKITEN